MIYHRIVDMMIVVPPCLMANQLLWRQELGNLGESIDKSKLITMKMMMRLRRRENGRVGDERRRRRRDEKKKSLRGEK